jgi:addiction module RelE/StbE family toxin
MNVDFAKSFNKQFEKLPLKSQIKAKEAVTKFIDNNSDTTLRNHALKGEWTTYRSISAGGDLRQHYKVVGDVTLFVAIGSHSQLYK